MNRKGFSPIIVLLVVGLFLVVGGGIMYSKAHQLAVDQSSMTYGPTSTQATTTITVVTTSTATSTQAIPKTPKPKTSTTSTILISATTTEVSWSQAKTLLDQCRVNRMIVEDSSCGVLDVIIVLNNVSSQRLQSPNNLPWSNILPAVSEITQDIEAASSTCGPIPLEDDELRCYPGGGGGFQ